ncbi:MAG TPA: malto-oligosyltrehalose trehalohydrolase [Jatrophihabitans sp.]|nr:malto-oligosyltrehalose trehalohydrolase [Jatrophihabitans sp.]
MRPAVWAPERDRVRISIRQPGSGQRIAELSPDPARPGWWQSAEELPAGTRYGYLLDDETEPLPDPRSVSLPDGVHGLTEVYDERAHRWTDAGWAGRELAGAVLYELHLGTFTPGGTLDSAVERLDHLVELGITHVELLPVNGVNGIWNWGYDGVAWYAVHQPYGGPDALKRFVQACHNRGLAVLLDVVYNHLGASGNYLPRFGPYLKTGRNTWGDLVNLDGPGSAEVRRYILDNALGWLREFHLDGLRLDAVHALADESQPHLLAELSAEVAELSGQLGRPLPLIAESDLNDPVMITPRDQGGYGLTGQWNDDVHHMLHALLTGERQGYYADFGELAGLAKVLRSAFFHDGTFSSFRGRPHGKPIDPATTLGWRFVVCLQNHDQIGNRAAGDRLPETLSPSLLRVAAVLLLSSPFTPMLFMGEEWAAGTRWPFFTSHPEPELAAAVSKGRLAEFAEHGWDSSSMPDPQDPDSYRQAVLDWSEADRPGHRELLELYRALIRLRRTEPDLADPRLDAIDVDFDERRRWLRIGRGSCTVLVNLAGDAQSVPLDGPAELLLATGGAELTGAELVLDGESAAIVRSTR